MIIRLNIFTITQLLLFAFFGKVKGQVNLVPNPSFETYTACPDFCEFFVLSNWTNPTNYSPDFFSTCVTNSNCGVPFNYYGNQSADHGNGYVGIITGGLGAPFPGVREYIQTVLTNTLQSNQVYSLKISISVADSVKDIANSIGVYFSNYPVSSNDNYVLPYLPQINFTNINNTNSKTAWTNLTGTFIAQGGENYITIGNFLNDNNSTYDTFQNVGNFIGGFSYLYIDNISITQLPNGIIENKEQDLFFSFYPEEVKDFVNIRANTEIKNIKIISPNGSLIKELKNNSKNILLDFSNFINGVYCLEFEFEEGLKKRKRLLINK